MANVNKTGGQPRVQQTQAQQKIQNTKKQIGQITHTILQLVPNDSSTKTKITRIAQELYDYADSHNGAIGQEGFSKLMKEITSLNVVGVILKYNELYNSSTSSFADNETIVETILDETSSSREDIREALLGDGKGKNKIRGLFTLLLDRAKEVGMDNNTIQSYRKQFETKLNKELNGGAAFRSSASMDEIINTVIQSIRNRIDENNKAAKANAPKKTVPAKTHETQATNNIVKRYSKAVKDFNAQLKADGWAEDIADAMGRLWGKNYADAVRKDLRAARKDIDRLKAALAKGDEAFRTEFLNIFGIAYDPANITAYQNAENAYTTALKAKSNEDSFNQTFSVLLKKGELKAEYETLTYPDTGVRTTATKEQVYQREFKKVAELFEATVKNDKSGQFAALGVTDGKSYVEKAIESAGAKGKSIDEKYKVLQNIVGKISQSLAQETKKACGGRSFSSIKTQYENCYKAAYGLENDILKRVTDYNISQQKGGGAVKGAVVAIAAIGLGILTAGGGTAAVAGGTGAATTAGTAGGTMAAGAIKGAATVSALTAITELSDKLTSKNGLRPEDIGHIAQASLVSGAMCLMFAGQSYAITNLTLKAATAAGMGADAAGYTAAALSTAGFVGTGLGTEYVFQGEISVEGATFTVIMALVSGVMQVKQVYQNARAVEAHAQEETMQKISDARKALGFGEDEVINLDKAEKAYKEIAKKHHPNSSARTGDGAMHDAIFAAANNAIEILRKNAMSINATVTKQVTNPQTSQPAQPKANPSHIPTAEDGAIVPISHYQAQPFTNTGVVPITVNGVNLNRTITNANNAVVTSETEMVGASTVINGKDANGNIITSTVDNGTIKSIQYIDGNNTVSQIVVKDAVVANYVVNANGNGVYTDVTGQVITEEQYNKIVNEAVNGQAEQVSMPLTPAQNNGAATVVELNPQVSAVAASGSGPVADPSAVPSQVTGGAAHTENVYEPVLDNGVGRSNTEIRATYEAVQDVGTLIKEYNFHKQAGGQELKLTILEDVINQRMTNIAEQARANVVTTENSEQNGMQVTTSKDANGTPVVTTTSTQLHNNKVVAQNVYNSNGISVSETAVDGKVIGSYITTGGEEGVYIDHYGYIITESQFNDAVSTAVAEPVPSRSSTPVVDAKTQAAVNDGLIRMDYINDVENALANPNTQNVVRNTMLRAKTQAELQYFADKFKNSPSTANRYTALKAEAYKDQLPVKPSEETLGMATGQNILPEGEAATKVPQPNTGLSEEFVEVKNEITRLQGELDNLVSPYKKAVAELETQREAVKLKLEIGVPYANEKPIVQGFSSENLEAELARIESELKSLTPPDKQAVTHLEQQIADLRGKAQAKIHELQQELKSYGAGTDRYDQIHMDRIQSQIKALREIAPLDRTNLQEVLQASPDEVFQPVKADNIKGQGISFKPYVPEDPEALAKVTYRAVPLYTEARTVEEMIRIAARDGVKIEMVQDADGNYYPGVKSVWSEGGYFKLDRDSYVVQYGEIPADDPYIDQAWAQQNKYTNADGKEVVMDCAIVAADKKTAADIMPHSYVKANGAQLSPSDKHNWNGFQAHKDPDGIVNAVAYDEPQELQTLEGKITTDVTMGDVEGNVYNKYNDLKKQILKDKLVANPDDPNSQKFIDLVKAGKDDEAIALLREATKASQAPEPAPADAKKPYVAPEITEASATPQTEVLASAPRTSSSYLDFTDRILHRTEYKLAKQLQEQGMEVKFGVDGKYSIEIDASQFDGLELLDGNYYHELYESHTVFEYSYKDGKLVITGQKAGGFASDAERMQFALDMRTKGAPYSNEYATGGKTVNTRSINEIIQSNIDKAKHSSQVLKDNGVTVTKFNHGDAARYKGDTYAPAEIRFTQNGKEYVGEYRGNYVEILPRSDLESMLADAIEGKPTDKFAIKEFDSATGEYKPVENISQTFAENKPRQLKLPRVSGGSQNDIVEGWGDFVSESKAVINSAASIDELRTLRDQIKNVDNKQAAQELREAYVQKEQQLRAAAAAVTPSQPSPSGAGAGKGAVLGESLTNPSFPTEFNETTFQAWADANGLTLSIEKGIALFRDADGNVVRRITNDYDHPGQVYDDHVVLYENGKEVAKFIKYTDTANVKYYYNYSETQGRYTGKAELRPDGQWYDLNTGLKLDKSPVTAKPNTVSASAKQSSNLPSTHVPTPKEAIFDFDYSSEWNPSKLQAWADKNGLTLSYTDNNRIADFKDGNGHVVRRVTQDWSDKTKVYDDKRAIYDKEGNLIGQLDKYTDETEPEYSFKHPGQTQKTYAKLGSDGLWYENKFVDGRFEKEILTTNPITGMPQVTGVNPEAKIELQVHEAEPAPASFENAGVPETTLSASYVEKLRASDSSSKFMSNIDNITKSALGEGRIRQSFYDKVQNAKTTKDLANCISDISSDTEGAYIQKIIELASKAEPGNAQLKQLANDATIMRNIYSNFNSFAIRGSKNITELKPVIEQFAQQHGYTVESGKDDWGFDCVKVKNTTGKTIREVSADKRGYVLEDEWFTYDANGNVVRNVSYDRGGEPSTIIQHYYKNGVETHSTGVDKGRDIAKVYVYKNGEPSVSYMHSNKVKATFGHELEGKELLDEPQQSSVPVDQTSSKETTEVTDKKTYVAPKITETSAVPQEDVLASNGTSSSGLWNRFKKAVGLSSEKTLDDVLESARKEGAKVEDLGNGEYRVTQRYQFDKGELKVSGADSEEYSTEKVLTYKDGNPEPIDEIRYKHDNWSNHTLPVVQRTMRDENGVTHYILDRSTGYGVEYSGYDSKGNKVPGKDQIVRVIGKDNRVLAEYSGEDIENALLAPVHNETDRYSQPLLNVKTALSKNGVSQSIVEWQATDGTRHMISSGQRFKPENFVKPVKAENIKEYTDVTFETPAFKEKAAEYNEFARARNLTIKEGVTDYGKNIQFKDVNGKVVRSITADENGTGISTDEFFELNRDGDIVQSATRDGSGKIISRTVNEYRDFWGKACTVTLDYIKGEAHTGLWLNGNLTNQQTVYLENGIALFGNYAGR